MSKHPSRRGIGHQFWRSVMVAVARRRRSYNVDQFRIALRSPL